MSPGITDKEIITKSEVTPDVMAKSDELKVCEAVLAQGIELAVRDVSRQDLTHSTAFTDREQSVSDFIMNVLRRQDVLSDLLITPLCSS